MLYTSDMRRFSPVLTIALAILPLTAAVPASRVKEPNAVFVYRIGPEEGRVQAVLFDRQKRQALDVLDAETDLPLYAGGGIESNDIMQFSPATGKIYVAVRNVDEYGGAKRIDPTLPYDSAIIETDFEFRTPNVVFSCERWCSVDQWLVHPTSAKLYVSLADPYVENPHAFKNAKLVEVTLAPSRRTRVLGRVPSHAALHVSPDGRTLFTFKESPGSRPPYGAVVAVDLRTRKRSQALVHYPLRNVFDLPTGASSYDLSPDAREFAYHMNVVDVGTGETETLIGETELDLDNYFIGWSRDSSRLLFQLTRDSAAYDREEVPLYYDRNTDETWELPLQDVHLLDWSPAQTAILFGKRRDVGFYDLEKREWVFVAEGENGSWVTMPTKRVPKR